MLTCDEAQAQWLAAFEESAKKLPNARREQLRQAVQRLTSAFASQNSAAAAPDISVSANETPAGLSISVR